MYEDFDRMIWDETDIRMTIKRYFNHCDRSDFTSADIEIDFMRSIHREWSFNPLMRRCNPATMAIIDEFLKWLDSTPFERQTIHDFTIRRLLR